MYLYNQLQYHTHLSQEDKFIKNESIWLQKEIQSNQSYKYTLYPLQLFYQINTFHTFILQNEEKPMDSVLLTQVALMTIQRSLPKKKLTFPLLHMLQHATCNIHTHTCKSLSKKRFYRYVPDWSQEAFTTINLKCKTARW